VIANVELAVGGNAAATSSLQPAVEFARRASDSGCPANSMIVVQTTSSLTTGALLYGSDGKGPAYSTLPDIIKSFVGTDMLRAMAEGNAQACTPSRPPQERWFQEAACSRGGWRGLLLAAQGPAIRSRPRLAEAIGLVEG
jgi:hypothetical protein